MTETPQPGPAETPQSPPAPAAPPASAPAPSAPAAHDPNAGVTAGAPAPNSAPTPGRGMPVAPGAPASVRPKMSATGLNVGFLVAGIVGVVLIGFLIYLVIHVVTHL